jgi:hypothetical protein
VTAGGVGAGVLGGAAAGFAPGVAGGVDFVAHPTVSSTTASDA